VKLNYQEYFDQREIEVREINIMEISNSLNIAKETTRRKINELETLGAIKRIKKKIIIDRETWPSIKPEDTMIRMSRFLSVVSKILYKEKLISESLTSDQIITTFKENFSYIWKLYFEIQIPMLLGFKKIYGDFETFHVHGICLGNQFLNAKKNNTKMSKEYFIEKYFTDDKNSFTGINAMSISDISGIPRATVMRKLDKLIKEKFLTKNNKKQYLVRSLHINKLSRVQKTTFINLSIFAECVYNLCLIKKNN
jgi:predicted transcriptional regulator